MEELVCTLNFVIVSWNQKFNFGKVSGSIFDFFKNYGRNVIWENFWGESGDIIRYTRRTADVVLQTNEMILFM